MSKKNVHTVYNNDRGMWETKIENQEKPISSSHSKITAEEKSVRLAKELGVEHIIHNKNGIISARESYGNDPNPPKDKEH